MALERSDVEKIAHLARLGLNDADIPQTTATLNNILGLIDAMQAVDTNGIEPLAHRASPPPSRRLGPRRPTP